MPDLSAEITYRTSRSGGKGGQNVNKVETAVEALWPVAASQFFSEEEKALLFEKLAARINAEGFLAVRATDTRSQLDNKAIATARLQALVDAALVKQKPRKKWRPSKGMIERRLESKRREGEKKAQRRRDW
jgi:ribosome-associated protein